jgi:septum formation protein
MFLFLKSLSNATMKSSQVCFKTNEKEDILHDVTKVTFKELSDAAIYYYLENYKPYDKAGAYGIQEWIGFIGVSKLKAPMPM